MLKPLLVPLVLLYLLSTSSSGQDNSKIDSLIHLLNSGSHDSTCSRISFEIAAEYLDMDTTLAIEYLERGKRISMELENTRGLGQYYGLLGKMHSYHGNYDLSLLYYDRALGYFSEADDDMSYYETVKNKGNVHLFRSEYTEAMNYYNSALDFYKRQGYTLGISRCLNNMGIIYKNRGEYVEALSVYEESVLYLDEEIDAVDIAQAYINMGNVFVYLGSYEEALEYFEDALEVTEKQNNLKSMALCLANLGVVQNKCSNYAEAQKLYTRSLQVSDSIHDPIQISNCLINLGTNYSDMGNHEKGLEYVRRGMEIKMDLGDERIISNCHIHMAEIYYAMKEYETAIDLFETAIPEKEKLGDQEGLVRCFLGLGSIYLDVKDYSEATMITNVALDKAMDIRSLEHIAAGFGIKRKIAEANGDFRSAYQFATQYFQYSDSLMNEAISKAGMELEFKYRSKGLEQENENLRIQSDLTAQLMRKRNAFMRSMAGIALLLALGLVLVYYFLRRLRFTSQKLEEQNVIITRQNLKLDNLNKTKDRMMSIIAHDLRGTIGNQLTALEVFHQVGSEKDTEINQQKLLGSLKHSATYSLELLENLLHWSRLGENETKFHPEEVNLEFLIASCIALFDETAANKGIRFQLQVVEPLVCRVDRIMIEIICRNLISNAIKFSNPGGIITVGAEVKGGNLFFRVADTGVGMTKDQIGKLNRRDGFTLPGTANEKGAGIGLTLVSEFTAMHQGDIKITSEPGKGSSFMVIIPSVN